MNLMRTCIALFGRPSLRKSLFASTLLFIALGLFSCNPWGELNNPADIKSDKFQGFEVSTTADGIKPYSPANGAALTDPPVEFVVSLVTGAEAYHLQISTTPGFEAPLVLDKADYATNKLSPGGADMRTGGTLYWRARAKKAGAWGAWTTVWSFSLPRKYIVSYDGNGNTGGIVPVDGNRYLAGTSVTVLGNTGTLTKTGFEFVGWNTAADGSGIFRVVGSTFMMGSGNVVLYAKWSPTFTVTYNGNGNTGGSVPVDENRYLTGASVTVLGNTGSLEKTGYSFVGWNTVANGSGTDRAIGSIFTIGSGNVVLYAKWSPTYTVTYNGNGNTGGSVPMDGNRYLAGSSVTVMGNTESLAKTGFDFVGWNTATNGGGADHNVGSTFTIGTGNVVLYAKWAPTYTVTYDGNTNTGGNVPVDGNRYLAGTNVTVLGNTGELIKTEFAFVGWNSTSNGSGTDRTVGSTFAIGSANVVLYAKWSPTYTVTYNGNGNTSGTVPVDGNRYLAGTSATVARNTGSLAKTEFEFTCWNTASNGSGTNRVVGSTFAMGSGNVLLYAKWASESITMVAVSGGSFQMGSLTDVGYEDERPAHSVTLTGFRIGKHEVTQAQYLSVTGASPSLFKGMDLPVEQVTWYDTVEFCNNLSMVDGFLPVYTITARIPASGYPISSATVTQDMTKNGYRLPTEAEWEYAARGGDGSPNNYIYSGSNNINAVGWWGYGIGGNSGLGTNVVGTKAENGLGLYDMTGNVWEFCQDLHGSYREGSVSDPMGASSGTDRIFRGGAWDNIADFSRSTYRTYYLPNCGFSSVGFRVVRRP